MHKQGIPDSLLLLLQEPGFTSTVSVLLHMQSCGCLATKTLTTDNRIGGDDGRYMWTVTGLGV